MKPTILEEIFEAKKRRVEKRRLGIDMTKLTANAYGTRSSRESNRLQKALSGERINIIAEFKRASPSKGIINDAVDAAGIVRTYENAGAKAISILTEEDYFKGSLDDLRAVRATVNLPILQKDFVFDEFQICEAAMAGADAILLIVAMLGDKELRRLHEIASNLGMDALVEVHDLEELGRAEAMGARLIGVNNRNLHTFDVSLDISRELIKSAPDGAIMVAESGLKTRDDLVELNDLGFNGFLIGETLMKADDPERALRGLMAI